MKLRRVDVVIDAGGSWVRAHAYAADICVETAEIRQPANPSYVGIDRSIMALEAVCEALGKKIGPTMSIRQITCAVAGAGRPAVRETIVDSLARNYFCDVFVCSDAESMLEAAAESGPVAVLIAGTGAIAAGRRQDGSLIRAGGLAPTEGDPGSGRWLARKGREQLKVELEELNDYDIGPKLESLALAGDAQALKLLKEGATCLVELLVALEPDAGPLVLEGGVITHSTILRKFFVDEVAKTLPDLVLAPTWRDAAWGALKLSRRAKTDGNIWWD
ncbi:MAG: N-acetylglucosamine kinase-like BadF-type ATPase [Planctomycetota bacterium]|jgi:N-acetylglucosamine kinase-like BadF-type ATPase